MMFHDIESILFEENNIHIAFGKDLQTLWLTPEGADLNDFAEFLELLCPNLDIESISVEQAIRLQQKLYDELHARLQRVVWHTLVKFLRDLNTNLNSI